VVAAPAWSRGRALIDRQFFIEYGLIGRDYVLDIHLEGFGDPRRVRLSDPR
jgi:hypothetical protein